MKNHGTVIAALALAVLLVSGLAYGNQAPSPEMSPEQMQAMMAEMVQSMFLEDVSPYGFDETVAAFEREVGSAGWSIVGVQDMQDVLAGHGHQVLPVKVFSLCSAKYSMEILELDDERVVSPLMPCRVAIYEKSDGNTYISRLNTLMMAGPMGGVIAEVMTLAAQETEDIISNVLQ